MQAQVFSLSVLVMSALDHEEKREISDLLHTLLSQMNSRQADNRPTLSTIISVMLLHTMYACALNYAFT